MARRRRDSDFTILAVGVVVLLMLAYYGLRFLFIHSGTVFFVCLALFVILRRIHKFRRRDIPDARLDETLGGAGTMVLGLAFLCMILFGGASLGKAVFGDGKPEQVAQQEAAIRESADRERVAAAGKNEPSSEGARRKAANRESNGRAEAREARPPSVNQRLAGHGKVVTMTRAVDGDTIEVSPAVHGRTEVRLIGIDTPEFSSECGTQPLAERAESYTAQFTGRKVALEFDVEKIDPYDRALAYVYVPNGTMLNENLLKRGLAQVATFPPNTRYEDRFLRAQREARSYSRGSWGLGPQSQLLLENRGNGIGGGCAAQPEPTVPPEPADPQPHRPAPDRYAPTPRVPAAPSFGGGDKDCKHFHSLAAVQRSIRAGDPHGLDGDGDGKACESYF